MIKICTFFSRSRTGLKATGREIFWGRGKKQFTESQVCVLKAMQLGCTKLGCRGVLTRLDR